MRMVTAPLRPMRAAIRRTMRSRAFLCAGENRYAGSGSFAVLFFEIESRIGDALVIDRSQFVVKAAGDGVQRLECQALALVELVFGDVGGDDLLDHVS